MERLKKPGDFTLCYKKGKMHKGRHVVIYVRANGRPVLRIGYSVSKKLGKAVVRNKVKRRLRAVMQQAPGMACTGADIVIAARIAAVTADFRQLQESVYEGLRRLGVMV